MYIDIKQITGRAFNPETKEWYVPLTITNGAQINAIITKFKFEKRGSETLLKDFKPKELSFKEKEVKDSFKKETLLKLSKLNLKRKPRDYQVDGICFHLSNKLVINGSDMGLGKTAQSLLAVECGELFPCLVICPSSVKYNWSKEWDKWLEGRLISEIESSSKINNWSSDVVVINYDIVGKKDGMRVVLKFPEIGLINWKSIIIDESHKLKNPKSIRSMSINLLTKKCENIYLLTGTPILNRPNELINQLNTIRKFKPLFGDWMSFIRKFCNAKKTPFGWDTSGASNLPELYSIMKQNTYFRVETKDVLQSLPEYQESVLTFKINNKKKYKDAVCDLILYLKKNKGVEAAERAESAQHLVMLMTLRQLSSLGKLKEIEEWLEDYLEATDRNILVFGIFKESLRQLSEKFNSKLIDGSTSSKKKQEIIDGLTKRDRMLFGNISSLGTGTDGLQAYYQDVLFIDQPDRPGDIDQAIKRVNRDGQKHSTNVYHAICDSTIDKDIYDMILKKREVTEAVNKGKTSGIDINVNIELLKKFMG